MTCPIPSYREWLDDVDQFTDVIIEIDGYDSLLDAGRSVSVFAINPDQTLAIHTRARLGDKVRCRFTGHATCLDTRYMITVYVMAEWRGYVVGATGVAVVEHVQLAQ